MRIDVTQRELTAIIGALRLYQEQMVHAYIPYIIEEVSTDCGRFTPIESEEIDELCERISIEGPRLEAVLLKDGEAIYSGSYNDCLVKLHQIQPNSWDYAMKHGGYKIVED